MAIMIFWKIIPKTTGRIQLLNMVAIGKGHPWHPSEEIGDTSVWLGDSEKWNKIPKGVRLFAQSDPIIERTLLKNNDEIRDNKDFISKIEITDGEFVEKKLRFSK